MRPGEGNALHQKKGLEPRGGKRAKRGKGSVVIRKGGKGVSTFKRKTTTRKREGKPPHY